MNDLNIAVITSTYVLEKKSPILEVIHNFDGIWEFYSNDPLDKDDYRVISLDEIIGFDITLYPLINMDRGYYAVRDNITYPWIISKIPKHP